MVTAQKQKILIWISSIMILVFFSNLIHKAQWEHSSFLVISQLLFLWLLSCRIKQFEYCEFIDFYKLRVLRLMVLKKCFRKFSYIPAFLRDFFFQLWLNVELLVFSFSFRFLYFEPLLFGTCTCRIVLFSWKTDPFTTVWYLLILCNISCSEVYLLWDGYSPSSSVLINVCRHVFPSTLSLLLTFYEVSFS